MPASARAGVHPSLSPFSRSSSPTRSRVGLGRRSTPIRSPAPIGRFVALGCPLRLVAAALVPLPSQPPSGPPSITRRASAPSPVTRQLLITPAAGAKSSAVKSEKLWAYVLPEHD